MVQAGDKDYCYFLDNYSAKVIDPDRQINGIKQL